MVCLVEISIHDRWMQDLEKKHDGCETLPCNLELV